MKKSIILLITLSLFSVSFAQENTENFETYGTDDKSTTSRADKFFKRMWYKEASELYESKLNNFNKKDNKGEDYIRILERAGDSYFFNTDMKNAYRVYNQLVPAYYPEINSEYLFRYAHSLEGVGKYKEAKYWMKQFAKQTKKTDKRAKNYNQQKQTIEGVLELNPEFVLHNLAINTKKSDFGPMYYKDKLVFSSANDSSYYHTRNYEWNEQPFLNMYVGNLNEIASEVEKIGEFSESLNTKYHEAGLAFTPDYKKVFFTRNNYTNGDLGRDKEGTNNLKLYSADLIKNDEGNEEWRNVQELPFNSEDYSVGHPTVSSDGKLLYFVSDMPGSMGGTDIFVVDILGDNQYSKPKNLGDTINTSGREMFPYITENSLYFASDGHLGLGGLDVFQSKIFDNTFTNPKNLGAPLNSKLDDFAFIIKEEENRGFVSSNRSNGKGDDDIYSFVRTPIEEAIVEPVFCNQLIKGYVSNTVTGERINQVKVTLFNEKAEEIETTTTNLNGAYVFKKALKCNTKYRVVASKTGYNQKDKSVLTELLNGETIVPLGLKTVDKLIVEENGLLKIKIGIIYFDLNKSIIRNDASIELNKVVVLMRQHPNMVIRIESHTDSRNTDIYNLSLSDKRAKATRDYLMSQGIGDNRIESAIGYGESQLINKCINGVKCSEAEHQLNRRSEFIILKM